MDMTSDFDQVNAAFCGTKMDFCLRLEKAISDLNGGNLWFLFRIFWKLYGMVHLVLEQNESLGVAYKSPFA